jgi:TonB family protein
MRKARLAFYIIFLAATAVWSQQTAAPKPDQAAPTPIVRNPHATKEDLAVPLCPATFDDSLETDGIIAKGTKGVTPPKPKYMPEARISDEALRARKFGDGPSWEAEVTFVVDVNGKPRDLCLSHSAGYGLDLEAAKAIQQYKFSPATKDGDPVSVRVSIKVDFRVQ